MNQRDKKLIEIVMRRVALYQDDNELMECLERFSNSPEYAKFLADNDEGLEVWVARDEHERYLKIFGDTPKPIENADGDIVFCLGKPENWSTYIPSDLFPEITFENSPVKFRLVREDEQ